MGKKIFFLLPPFLVVQLISIPPSIYSQVRDSLINIIYLKDGTEIKGTVIGTEPGKTITIKTSEGIIQKYNFKKDIENMDVEVFRIEPTQESKKYDLERESEEELIKNNSPKNTFGYFSIGSGFPQIFKCGLGLHIGIYNWGLGLAFNFGAMYFKPKEIGMLREMVEFTFKIYFPKLQGILTPYASMSGGGAFFQLNIWGGASKPPGYGSYYLGTMISLESWLQACPELGLLHTSVGENKTSFGFNVALEIIF